MRNLFSQDPLAKVLRSFLDLARILKDFLGGGEGSLAPEKLTAQAFVLKQESLDMADMSCFWHVLDPETCQRVSSRKSFREFLLPSFQCKNRSPSKYICYSKACVVRTSYLQTAKQMSSPASRINVALRLFDPTERCKVCLHCQRRSCLF